MPRQESIRRLVAIEGWLDLGDVLSAVQEAEGLTVDDWDFPAGRELLGRYGAALAAEQALLEARRREQAEKIAALEREEAEWNAWHDAELVKLGVSPEEARARREAAAARA